MNMRFTTTRSFDRASSLICVCLASLYPLTLDELRDVMSARFVKLSGGLADFDKTIEQLAGLLVKRRDGTLVFFHPTFREWLVRRDDMSNAKFLCDTRLLPHRLPYCFIYL